MTTVVEAALMTDLTRNSSSSAVILDPSYNYFDTYNNTCLSKNEACASGFTIVFNLTLSNVSSFNPYDFGYYNGRVVLASSGGDSPYSTAGFYLHQVNVRGDSYLEFGIALYNQIFTTKVIT